MFQQFARTAAVLTTTLALGALAACSGSDEQAITVTGAEALAAAASETASTTYSIDAVTTVKLSTGDTQKSEVHGARSGDSSRMTMEIPVQSEKLIMDIVAGDGGRQFLRYSGLPAGSPLPDGWVELTGAGNATNAVASSASVESFLDVMQRKGARVTEGDGGTRDGVKIRRFTTTLDLSPAYQLDTDNRTMKRIAEATAKTMSKVDAEIEVDEQDRVRRIAYDVETGIGDSTTVMTLSKFGEPVTVDIPNDATSMTLDEFAALIYPNAPESDQEVDDADLVDRDEFVEQVADASGLTEDVAGCVYDEIKASTPAALIEEPDDEDEATQLLQQAAAAATMVCGMGG
jgi:hypothetical protein